MARFSFRCVLDDAEVMEVKVETLDMEEAQKIVELCLPEIKRGLARFLARAQPEKEEE